MDEDDLELWFLVLAISYLTANFAMVGAWRAGGDRASIWILALVAAVSSCWNYWYR